eukprot:scaffold44003_cov57-Attheya_sp.AAC.1
MLDSPSALPSPLLPGILSKGAEFDLFYFLYVDDGAMLFDTREDLAKGTQLLFSHFARFGLEMHIGIGDKKSKTECVHFPAVNQQQPANLENIQVEQGFVSFTNCFKYLGSIILSNLNDEIDIDARISQELTRQWAHSVNISDARKSIYNPKG